MRSSNPRDRRQAMKRKRGQTALDIEQQDSSSSDTNAVSQSTEDDSQNQTPTKRRRTLPSTGGDTVASTGHINSVKSTPTKATRSSDRIRVSLLKTPTKTVGSLSRTDTPTRVLDAERSARRKSARKLIERPVSGVSSDEEELEEEEDLLAQDIWGTAEADGEGRANAHGDIEEAAAAAAAAGGTTPTPKKRGRPPKTPRSKRSPTPPHDLPPHEQYFYHNRPGGNKTSNNTLASLSLLNHEEYFSLIRNYVDPHESERAFLHEIHARSFEQWRFELSEGFSLCLYGWGSKRQLTQDFAHWLYRQSSSQADDSDQEEGTGCKIVVVNGYVSSVSIKEVINTVLSALDAPNLPPKLTGQPADMLETLLSLLTEHASLSSNNNHPITLIINSIDGPPLRRPATQSLLSRLAAHKAIHLLATADHPSFPLLWDSSLRESFNFLFHDCTTFEPYEAEIDVVDSVNELLGRTGRRVGGREGVGYVLKSLPENARSLYRVLVGEQLAGMEDGLPAAAAEEDEETGAGNSSADGVEYRVLYQKAVEEFICSSEVAFRTLLKEYVFTSRHLAFLITRLANE